MLDGIGVHTANRAPTTVNGPATLVLGWPRAAVA